MNSSYFYSRLRYAVRSIKISLFSTKLFTFGMPFGNNDLCPKTSMESLRGVLYCLVCSPPFKYSDVTKTWKKDVSYITAR